MERNSNFLIAEQETVRRMHYLMGTFVQIEVRGEERKRIIGAVEAAFREIKRVERILSKYLDESQIFKINQFARLFPLEIESEVFQLLQETVEFSRLTKGAFDISVGGVVELWDSAQKRGVVPKKEDIEEILPDYNDIILDPENNSVLFKRPGIKIDLGGIGKGYAIDKAIEVLKENNIDNALVNAGGNIFCLDSDYAPIGIKDPLDPDEVIATVSFKNKAIATSANYERPFDIQGKTYGHLIDPKTGFPVRNEVLSVSIISPSARISDVVSTAVFILGSEEGMDLVEGMDGLEGIIVANDEEKIRFSSGLNEISELTHFLN